MSRLVRTLRAVVVAAAAMSTIQGCGDDNAGTGESGEDVVTDIADVAADSADADAEDAAELDAHDAAADSPSEVAAIDVGDPDAGTDAGAEDLEPVDAAEDAPAPDVAADVDDGHMTAARCFAGQLPADGELLVDYDSLGAVVGSHCMGTNHQDIVDIERVVIAGDSLAVGTPPTAAEQWWRNRLAAWLVAHFRLAAPGFLWQQADVVNGVALQQHSGDFWSCAKWGARTDDIFSPPHQQLVECNPEAERDKRTLIVMTVGGNDIFSWAQDMQAGAAIEDIQAAAEQAVADLEEAVRWVVAPETFPNGVYLVFASNFEFTDPDSGNDFASCPGAGIISMDVALVDSRLHEIARWVMEQYMRIAVETGTDMIFMGEQWCGHGHMNDDPAGRCYRGPGTALWSDITCMHPNGDGHAAIAEMFEAVIAE